ncbi:MAG: PCRF domain-containing protein, partial [Defluviitaleaceae bacterium]|nr:PCRF domain-containing protein [Defluviitaleaceae bacterium]
MFDKLTELETKYDSLSAVIADPAVIAGQPRWRGLMKEHSDLTPIVEKYREHKKTEREIAEAKEMLEDTNDDELKRMAKDEIKEKTDQLAEIAEELKLLLLPKDPNDDKNVIVEIRGGAGGDEAALFAGRLFRMYSRYAERRRWKTELMNLNEIDMGGFKEAVFMITGKGAFSRLKFESGVHRVQRVHVTESQGSIHTSTVTVAPPPAADEVDVALN